MGYLLGIDQGTSGSRALLLDEQGGVRGYGYRPVRASYPGAGRVEQDPEDVAGGVVAAIADALADGACAAGEVEACGIACQRNTEFVWDAAGGRPLAPAITWQDVRAAGVGAALADRFRPEEQRWRLGHLPGAFSSALHLAWRLREQPAVREAAQSGRLRFGFSGSWLLHTLGRPAGYEMDFTMIQASGLYDLRAGAYWQEWVQALGIPADALPTPAPTVHPYGVLQIEDARGGAAEVPVTALIGDQQAALFGFDCRRPGEVECTHGTASFVNACLGGQLPERARLNLYYAWVLEEGDSYCLEARTAGTGSVINWLRDELRLVDDVRALGPLAQSVPDSGDVVFVPAFSGLYDPANDRSARGMLIGLTHAAGRAHIARAFCESLACQIGEILDVVEQTAGIEVGTLKMGGGVARSDAICQIQADLLQRPVERVEFVETTARAAALLAGMGSGRWKQSDDLPPLPSASTLFRPELSAREAAARRDRWREAAERARGWARQRAPRAAGGD